MKSEVIEVTTGRVPAVFDLTDRIVTFVRDEGDGLVTVFVPHATAGVAGATTCSPRSSRPRS